MTMTKFDRTGVTGERQPIGCEQNIHQRAAGPEARRLPARWPAPVATMLSERRAASSAIATRPADVNVR
jgi:hypothetical protein